jgi:TIR domain-containing protein
VAKKVFISYRREDTGPAAGRVYDRLARLLPNSNLFFDVSTIGGGEDFVQRIEAEIGHSDAALVFIGDKWLEPAHRSERARIWDADDFVRAELRAALARPMLILPILVAGARMPKPEQLPEDVRAVALKNALPLRHESFDDDTESIVAAVFGASAKDRAWDDKGSLTRTMLTELGGRRRLSTHARHGLGA